MGESRLSLHAVGDLATTTSLGPYQSLVEAALFDLVQQDVMARIWAHDYTVWKSEPTEIVNRLGWLHTAALMQGELPRLKTVARAAREDGYRRALVLGMGGSSLAPELFGAVFGAERGAGLAVKVLDSTDPGAVLAQLDALDLDTTLFIVSTKSGTTVETLSFFKFFYGQVAARGADEGVGRQFLAITDPGTWLVDTARQHKFREIFLSNPNIGGRYSALSLFGLAPAALLGMDLERLLERAIAAAAVCGPGVPVEANPAAVLGCILGELAKAGRDKVTLVIPPAIASLGDWLEQLLAESTGKEGRAVVPVVREPVGSPDAYGEDRLFVWIGMDDDLQCVWLDRMEQSGHPVVRLTLRDTYDLGGQFFLWELATAVAGSRLGINPFDQPNVEAAKILARQLLAEQAEGPALVDAEVGGMPPEELAMWLNGVRPGDYVALQAYVQPTRKTTTALQSLRACLQARLGVATTLGYGPRYLHSTGQMHKGDRGNGWFVQFTADDLRDVAIPDQPGAATSAITFGTLKAAQALGDRQALADAGRQVAHLHLGADASRGVGALADVVRRMCRLPPR